jgi:AcrR family transcriptional regulator
VQTPEARLRPRKVPRQERARRTRQRILDAAAHVFGEYGYAAGTTNRIADAAGISIGTLYQHFPNKDAVLVALMEAHVDEGVASLQRHLAAGLPERLEERLRLFVRAVVDNHRGDGRLHQVLFEESPRPRPLLDRLHELEAVLVETVAELLREDERVTVPDHRLAAWMLIATIESLTHRFAAARSTHDSAAFVEEAVAMLSAYLTR